MRQVIIVDNFDSFTFNLVEAFERLGAPVTVLRNTAPADEIIARAAPSDALICLSPGPATPQEAGCCLELIRLARGRLAVFGICLGHQALVAAAGGDVLRAERPVHGQASLLHHDGEGILSGVASPLRVGRYHSLCTPDPEGFHMHGVIDGMAMAISNPGARQAGVQFHPESILTLGGDRILANALAL